VQKSGYLNEAFVSAQEGLKRLGLDDITLDTSKATYDTFIGRMHRAWRLFWFLLAK